MNKTRTLERILKLRNISRDPTVPPLWEQRSIIPLHNPVVYPIQECLLLTSHAMSSPSAPQHPLSRYFVDPLENEENTEKIEVPVLLRSGFPLLKITSGGQKKCVIKIDPDQFLIVLNSRSQRISGCLLCVLVATSADVIGSPSSSYPQYPLK